MKTPPPPPTGPPMGSEPPRHQWPTGSYADFVLSILWVILVVYSFVGVVGSFVDVDTPGGLIASIATFQIAMVAFPIIVTRWKGTTLREDWGLAFDLPGDLGRGFMLGVMGYFAAAVTSAVVAAVIRLPDTADPSNDEILTDHSDSALRFVIVFFVVIGAPFAEELFFRGVMLRSLQRSAGIVAAIIISSVFFSLGHLQDATWKENMVLLSALGALGAVLAWGAWKWERLAPPMIAHLLFNGTSTIFILT